MTLASKACNDEGGGAPARLCPATAVLSASLPCFFHSPACRPGCSTSPLLNTRPCTPSHRHTVVQSSKWLPNQSVPLPQISIPASPLSGASRGRQQREQKKQLQTLERQLQLDLGTKHQWLLDMHLGCTGQLSSNGSLQHSSCSSNGSVPATGVSSSPAVASTVLLSGASGQLSPHSIGVDSQSQMMGLTNTECADSTCSGSSALQQQLQGVQQQQQPNHEDWALPDSPPPVQVVLPPLDRQDPDEEEQDTPSSEQPGQALPPSALLQQQQGPLQHRDGSSTAAVAAADVRISLPDSPESTGGSLANSTQELEGSAGSYPSTGQPLTPNQRVGLQRYLMRQHQLIQTSGMRVRSASAPLPPPVPVAGVAVKAQDVGGAPGNGNDTTGMSDTPDTSGRSPRRPQELSRCRTYIVQGTELFPISCAASTHGPCCKHQHAAGVVYVSKISCTKPLVAAVGWPARLLQHS